MFICIIDFSFDNHPLWYSLHIILQYIIQEQKYRKKSEYFYLEVCDEKGVEEDQLKQSELYVFVVMTLLGSHVRCPCFCKTKTNLYTYEEALYIGCLLQDISVSERKKS